jgi:two-component system cell cycle response regulator DivK
LKKITKVLLVDDDALLLRTVGRILLQRGYDVYTSGTATGIVNTVIKCEPDVILMDHYMPEMSGKQAIKMLRANELTRNVPVIYFSTYASLDVLSKDAGADAFVSKASPIENLIDSIDSLAKQQPEQ